MNDLLARIRVIVTAAPTWLTGASVLLTVTHAQIADLLPEGAAETTGRWVLVACSWLGAAVAIIRRVTPVPPDDRGVLPG